MKKALAACYKAEAPAIRAVLAVPSLYVVTLVAALWGYLVLHGAAATLVVAFFGFQLTLLSMVDLRHHILPHLLTGMLIASGIILAPAILGLPLVSGLGAAVGGFVLMLGCSLLTEKFTGEASLGGGDLWLTAGIGAWIGLGAIPMFVLMLAVLGGVSVVANRLGGGGRQFPFGPALAGAGWLALLYQAAYWHAIVAIVPR